MSSSQVTWRYVLAVVTVTIGSSFQFYSYAIVNSPQAIVAAWMNETITNRRGHPLDTNALTALWALTSASISIGGFIGCIFTRLLAERYGRRNGLIINGAINVVAGVFEASAKGLQSPELLIIGIFLIFCILQ